MTNAIAHHCHLGETTFIYREIRTNFIFVSHFFFINFLYASRITQGGMSRFAASHLGLNRLPMSLKMMSGLNELISLQVYVIFISRLGKDASRGRCLTLIQTYYVSKWKNS